MNLDRPLEQLYLYVINHVLHFGFWLFFFFLTLFQELGTLDSASTASQMLGL